MFFYETNRKNNKKNMGAYGAPLQQNQVHDKHGE